MQGIFSALMCAFTEEGDIHEAGLRQIVRYNIDQCQIDGLYVNGSTGENFMLSTDEKKRIFKVVKEEVGSEVKLIAQIGSINIREAIELAQYATTLGYDAISAVTPYYYKFDFDEIKEYYNTITSHTDNKLIVYSIPGLTGVDLSLDQFEELFRNEQIIGVKFTAPDFFLLERLRHRFPDKFIYSGFDEMLLSAAVLNVDGAIGSTYNINGEKAKQILTLAKEGNIEEARLLQKETNNLISGILENGLYPTIKEMLKYKGVDAGFCRPPTKTLTRNGEEQARVLAKRFLQ
ncbi:N-acetylneuraminate lyase [Virgibacillus ihumii]|uniref:N-acetylneuraminate lyase n=1 Tax=Virgibacillus ihumii TaxID=2686091 RepID=UPI00157CDD77|nr:N-acetylneuraminate lyase [Virgibacillus ihumii]